ncbi:MAG: hypothetical protein K2N05_08485 [Muribaculaceae bacterium]|nr:hypothetical protein [Muribaculaceae bacterium]
MSKLGLKYFSPGNPGIPAVNGGKWNIATNYNVDFTKILQEVGIKKNDFLSVCLFLRFSSEGLFVCAAKRREVSPEYRSSFEALWIFVPIAIEIPPDILSTCVEELPLVFDHPEAFESPEAFIDIVPEIFHKDFPDKESQEEKKEEDNPRLSEALSQFISEGNPIEFKNDNLKEMKGSRVGYLALEDDEELQLVLSGGFKKQYRHFGLILLTDNPVKVESSLPGIFLPELLMLRQKRLEEDNIEGVENSEDESQETVEEITEATGEKSEDPVTKENIDTPDDSQTHLEEGENLTNDSRETSEIDLEDPDSGAVVKDDQNSASDQNLAIDQIGTPEDIEDSNTLVTPEESDKKNFLSRYNIARIDRFSFLLGFATATIIFIFIYLMIL